MTEAQLPSLVQASSKRKGLGLHKGSPVEFITKGAWLEAIIGRCWIEALENKDLHSTLATTLSNRSFILALPILLLVQVNEFPLNPK